MIIKHAVTMTDARAFTIGDLRRIDSLPLSSKSACYLAVEPLSLFRTSFFAHHFRIALIALCTAEYRRSRFSESRLIRIRVQNLVMN